MASEAGAEAETEAERGRREKEKEPGAFPRLLVADRDRQLLSRVQHELADKAVEITVCQTLPELLVEAAATRPDTVLLDIGLPGGELPSTVRLLSRRLDLSVVLAAGPDQGEEISLGLAAGAAACLPRPYGPLDLLRLATAGITSAAPQPLLVTSVPLRAGDLELDPVGYQFRRHGTATMLPLREFQLLACLMARPNQVVSREALLDQVWGSSHVPESNTLSVHIGRLRKRLAQPPASCCTIDAVRGLGYRLVCP
ncbi:response regulator transcription factor [Streptomyces sp. NPDC041068]|uniref:winged helix-turn-helix transcriptional regulator n=1 Tax=Streptomyces sp. NPDC041068 TaxID=3155130 RepID=UPI0033F7B965